MQRRPKKSWDPLSHDALLKTLLATLCRSRAARIYVVSGLHTGRQVLLAFQRKAWRAGLELKHMDEGPWPPLPPQKEEEQAAQVEAEEQRRRECMLELRLAPDDDDDDDDDDGVGGVGVVVNCAASAALLPPPPPTHAPSAGAAATAAAAAHARAIRAHSPRLAGARRPWQDAERAEERKEVGGVRERNAWITVWCLGWKADEVE